MQERKYNEINAVLLVDKHAGCTSHDIVGAIRRTHCIRKVGHAGTLDPFATGLLVILLGKATKLSMKLTGLRKAYTGTARLGTVTDSQDIDGNIIQTNAFGHISEADIEKILPEFRGQIKQLPPMFSATKVKGKKLYELARKGKEIERAPKDVTVYELEMLSYMAPDIEFKLDCSRGTYVRTVFHDIGTRLGCGAHLQSLRRTAVGPFRVEKAHSLEKIKSMSFEELVEASIPLESLNQEES